MKTLLLSLFLLICLVGCYEPTEGCLEFWATNYDVLADEPCEDDICCIQPNLSMSIKYYKNDSTEYTFGDTLIHTPTNRYYSLISSNLFTHNYIILREGSSIPLDVDSTLINSKYYSTNFGFSNKQGSSIILTRYKDVFDFDEVNFTIGIPPLLQDTTIFGADSKIVASAIDTLYNIKIDTFFSTFSCNISLDTAGTIGHDTSQYKSTISDNLDISLLLSNVATVNFGSSSTLEAQIAVTDWIDEIDDLELGNKEEIANRLAETLENHITIE